MKRPRARITPTCRECGYDLAGIAVGQERGVCPECGAEFDPKRPWLWPPWPSAGRILARMVLPLAIGAALVVAGRLGPWGLSVCGVSVPAATLGTGVIFVAFIVAIAGAVVVVTTMTDRHLPMPQGRWIKGGLIVLSLVVNLGGVSGLVWMMS